MLNTEDPGWTTQLAFDPETLERRRTEKKTFFVPACGMNFVDDHFGPRPGCLHTLLGSTGRGKSTLVQSLMLKWGEKSTMLLYLTEESIDRVELKIAEKEFEPEYLSTKLHIVHENEVLKTTKPQNYKALLQTLQEKITACFPEIVIIDNITTSQFYEGQFQNVMGLLSGLRELAHKNAIPMFLICHTKKGVNETSKGLIMPDDVRGSSTLAMTSDYFYTFYRVRISSLLGTPRDNAFIYVNKCRDHDTQDSIYRLEYDIHRGRYVKDVRISFSQFKEIIKDRERI